MKVNIKYKITGSLCGYIPSIKIIYKVENHKCRLTCPLDNLSIGIEYKLKERQKRFDEKIKQEFGGSMEKYVAAIVKQEIEENAQNFVEAQKRDEWNNKYVTSKWNSFSTNIDIENSENLN